MSQQKILRLFTTYFPGGKYEVYMENEIRYLAKEFDKIYIYPLKDSDYNRVVPANCELVIAKSVKQNSRLKLFIRYPFLIFKLIFQQLIQVGFTKTIKNKSFLINYLFNQLNLFHEYKNTFSNAKNDIYYSNWFVDWSLALSLLKSKNIINSFVVRAHRYDLYEAEYPIGFIPFRKFQIEQCNAVASISLDGLNYLRSNYESLKAKTYLFRLGSSDNGINPQPNNDKIRIITCSNLKPVKRIHLLIEALKQCKSEIEWNHFGDGVLNEEIQNSAKGLPENINSIFHGRVSAQVLHDFYLKNPVHVLINLSSSEGIPVSIMEAISYGIPVIATDVGGTSEIVNSKTGMLLKSNFEPHDLASLIDQLNNSNFASPEFRKSTREFWMDNYNEKFCFPAFAKFLIEHKY